MTPEQLQSVLQTDRNDLLAVLRLRFGTVPEEILEKIEAIADIDVLERLILAAANAASWGIFMSELYEGRDAFRLVGESFNPIAKNPGGV
ncbi:hypothetical protein [Aneurinibacillus terranovensis]|uniref:hypothetical protein n=1 Tax=Aneurinibacillus terranovensis TaxID=278991 RepID=UPI0004236BC2|nr:hypothetical protein [Aneurinibacillus terranovensis]